MKTKKQKEEVENKAVEYGLLEDIKSDFKPYTDDDDIYELYTDTVAIYVSDVGTWFEGSDINKELISETLWDIVDTEHSKLLEHEELEKQALQ